jgi:hypothetical protein
MALVVEGELFRVREETTTGGRHTYHYDWSSGPNPGYGFMSSGPAELTDEEHASSVRDFLAGIDPRTGYLGPD